MAETVRVSGLPADIEDERLKDKLFIHFLRARNGGGEINSVTIVKATPISALITFEDSGVAQRVIEHSPHLLEVDGKKYKVVVIEHSESLDPDKVILHLSAIVDYSQLPGGLLALSSLHKSHPEIKISHDATEILCTLHGAFSKVQAALEQLLGHPGGPKSAEKKDSGQPATRGSRSVQIAQKPQTLESEDLSRKSYKQREKREKVDLGMPSDENNSSSRKPLTPAGSGLENNDQIEGPVLQLPGHPTASGEDLSLILDADMFEYLKKHCRKEYQHILSQYSVDVVDMTNHGLTTLFLKVASGVEEGGEDQKRLKLARQAISSLYQENEKKIRRGQLSKNILSLRGGLQKAMEILSVRFPKLLLNEDDQNIYIIGSSSDVSEAKQFLLLDPVEVIGKKENVASLLKYPSYSGSSTHSDEFKVPLMVSSSLDDRIEEDGWKAEGARNTTSLSGGPPLPPAGSGSTLRRASSFSGSPQQKAQVMSQKSQDDSGKPTVAASLLEVFTGDSSQIPEQHDFSGPSTSDCNPSTFLQMNEDQNTSLRCYSYPQVMLNNPTGKANGTDSQGRTANHRSDIFETDIMNGAISQPSVRKDPVIKEKVKIVNTLEIDGQKTETFVNHSKAGNDRPVSHVNDVESTTTPADEDLHKQERTVDSKQEDRVQQRQTKIPDTEESRSNPEGCVCVCGESEMLMKTKCGAAFCSKCLDVVHSHCRVCHKQTSQGIQGEMTICRKNISVPGHTQDSAITITYVIPDGIQGEDHPSPGEPFQGGTFEAYLPDSQKTRKLVYRLKKAFEQGLTFTVTGKDTEARVAWDGIPHKTTVLGGKSANGYPDSTYLTRLTEVLDSNGIEEQPAKS
ncbi:E3 ubiquitin-protein ligase DTX3L [Dissostichus eleginoides]|uniref:E3 ubiquitin-protein ligase n=1 Tax=Dissostichus eleginoides TaxID=100907 RepID=A0AAD9B4K6_DISEL|nr:E3 ubiquitin-protein ligase DTX3L [Dissostichus eleginoides]